MKKILLFASALAGLFLAGSCQQENLEPVVSGNTVTYTVQVADAVATRALGDDITAVNELVYEVYRTTAEGVEVFSDEDNLLYHKTAEVKNGVATIKIEFVNDQNFTVLFWAHTKDNGVYNVENLTNVTITSPDVANNVKAQAFVGRDFVRDCVSDAQGKVTLVRPVSQLNIATTPESLVFESETGETGSTVVLEGSSVKVTGLATSYNIATLSAFGATATEYTYTETAVPTVVLPVNGKDYTYVAMNYVGFAPEMGTSDVTVSYVINTSEGNIDNEILNVPVKPNYRTNIIGNLITSKTAYTIELDETWGTPEEVVNVVNTAAGLQEAIDNAEEGVKTEIKLEGDIDLNDLLAMTKAAVEPATVVIEAGKNIVLDLNGFSLTATDETEKNYSIIDNRGTLVVKNSKEGTTSSMTVKATVNSGWNRYSAVLANNPGGHLTVESGVVIEHLGGTDMAYGIDNLTNGKGTSAVTVINGATVKSPYRAIRQFLNGTEANNSLTVKSGSVITSTNGNKSIWMQDPSANANTGSLVVEEGAELYGNVFLSVTAGSTEWPVSVSVAASALKGESVVETNSNVPVGYSLENKDGVYTVEFHPVAMIGEKGYATLNAAVAAVQDGGTITLVADETFTETNRYNNGGWWDGLGYSGDKSFTIDLGGYTIKQDGSLNDYLIWIKNDGAKANTITFKNGTMDAGTTAYCALCTANSHENKLTVNLENIILINENSNGSTVKIRAGSELNVRAGTKITGKNSYLGIENWNAVVNIYDGAEIYMNGTTSYNGCLVGVGGNGTVNVYGGYGKGVSGGLIAMTSGGTINAMGGEWIANTDGTFANSNKSVLVAQSDKQHNAGAGNAVVNVTGGTYKGGYNCYGNAVGDAQINISGGNFNADPTSYVVNGYKAVESNGVYNVVVDPVAKIGETEYATLQEAFNVGGNITLLRDVTVSETTTLAGGKTAVLNLNGKTLSHKEVETAYAINNHGNLTITGNGTVNSRGIYNGYDANGNYVAAAKLTIENGTFNAKGTNGGACVYNYGTVAINGGNFESVGGYGLNNQSGAVMTLKNASVRGGIYVSGATLKVENSTVYQHISGRHAIYNWSGNITVESGSFDSESGNELILADGTNASVVLNGGTYNKTAKSWLLGAATNKNISFVINGGTYNGYVNLPENTVDTIRPYGDPIVVKGGVFNFNPTQWLAEGYEAVNNNSCWTVQLK